MGTGMPKDAEAPKPIFSLASYNCHVSSRPVQVIPPHCSSSASMPTAKPIQSKTGQSLDHSEALKRKQQNNPIKSLRARCRDVTKPAWNNHSPPPGQQSDPWKGVFHTKSHRYYVPSQMSHSSSSSSRISRRSAYSERKEGGNKMKENTNQEHENFILCQENLLVSLQ